MDKKSKKAKSPSKPKNCQVCMKEREKNQKYYCKECAIIVRKAAEIIKNSIPREEEVKEKLRKPVQFNLKCKKRNKLLFAREMRKSWDNAGPEHLCPYTLLPMKLENPVPVQEAREDEEKRKERKAFKYLIFSPDRIKSSLNYRPKNIRVCTYLGNIMKTDLEVDEFNSVIIETIKDKISIKEDKELVRMLIQVLWDFYARDKLSKEELEEHSVWIDDIKKEIDKKKS